MKTAPLPVPPPESFLEDDLYSRKRCKAAQHMAEEFWKGWRAKYFQNISIRQKWMKEICNIKVGDVAMTDDQAPRNDWKVGIVTEAIEGSDGLVRNS